jgi:hypothetical protein
MFSARLVTAAIAISLATVVLGCGGSSGMAPTITAQPQDQTVAPGASATFSVTATGSMPLNYQWSKNGVILPGATSATLTVPNVVQQDDGSTYRVGVSNNSGNVSSNTATLHVVPVP